jgi:O-antigen/teichoic acid export membrane protein
VNFKVIKDLLLNNLSQGLQFGFQWLLNIMVLKELGLDFFGEYSFYYSISSFLMPILSFGSYVYLMKESFRSKEDSIERFLISSQLQVVFFSFVTFLSCIIFFIFQAKGDFTYLILALLNGYLLSLNTLIYIFHKSIGNFKIELLVNVFKALLICTLIVLILFPIEISIFSLLLYLLVINFISVICSFLKSDILNFSLIIKLFNIDFKVLKKQAYIQRYFGFQDILTVSFVQGGMLILPLILINETYGVYRGLLLIVAPFGLINLSFSQVLLNQVKGKSIVEIKRVFHLLLKIASLLLFIVLGLLYNFREFILKNISKIELTETINYAFLGILSIIFFSFIYSGYEMLLVALEKQKIRFIVMVVGALVNLLAIILLLPQYGILGAIGTNVISTFIVFVLILVIGESQLKKK